MSKDEEEVSFKGKNNASALSNKLLVIVAGSPQAGAAGFGQGGDGAGALLTFRGGAE